MHLHIDDNADLHTLCHTVPPHNTALW